MMAQQDPLAGKPSGVPPQAAPQTTAGPGQPAVNLCDYNKGAKEPPPLDLMTKPPPAEVTASVPPVVQPPPGQTTAPNPSVSEVTSPIKEYPGGMSAASLAAQQHQQQQAKVLSHYYPYK